MISAFWLISALSWQFNGNCQIYLVIWSLANSDYLWCVQVFINHDTDQSVLPINRTFNLLVLFRTYVDYIHPHYNIYDISTSCIYIKTGSYTKLSGDELKWWNVLLYTLQFNNVQFERTHTDTQHIPMVFKMIFGGWFHSLSVLRLCWISSLAQSYTVSCKGLSLSPSLSLALLLI